MLFERQRVLLTLLDALGGQVSPTDFQKLLFLYTRRQETAVFAGRNFNGRKSWSPRFHCSLAFHHLVK